MKIELDDYVVRELEYLVELHQEHGAPNPQASVEGLMQTVAAAIADGSRRPGSWERGLLVQLGLVPQSPDVGTYREEYGRPAEGAQE